MDSKHAIQPKSCKIQNKGLKPGKHFAFNYLIFNLRYDGNYCAELLEAISSEIYPLPRCFISKGAHIADRPVKAHRKCLAGTLGFGACQHVSFHPLQKSPRTRVSKLPLSKRRLLHYHCHSSSSRCQRLPLLRTQRVAPASWSPPALRLPPHFPWNSRLLQHIVL